MAWRVVVRAGPRVEKARPDSLEAALDLVEERARELARSVRAETVDVHVRRYEPADQVAARLELRGPQRWRPDVRAGLDVHGDGSVVAWRGGVSREALDGPTPYAALRQSVSVEP